MVDDKTLTVTTKWPTALSTFENNFGRYALILPKHVLKDVPRADLLTYEWFNHPDVISGPYFINDFDLQHYVHYVANENYFLGAPKIKYLNINVVAASQMLAGLQSGEIDLVQQTMGSIPVEDYEAVKALANVTAVPSTPVTNELHLHQHGQGVRTSASVRPCCTAWTARACRKSCWAAAAKWWTASLFLLLRISARSWA